MMEAKIPGIAGRRRTARGRWRFGRSGGCRFWSFLPGLEGVLAGVEKWSCDDGLTSDLGSFVFLVEVGLDFTLGLG